jgi:hypothetical protein
MAAAASLAAAPASPPATMRADLQSWVEQLNTPDPADRDSAERNLAAAGSSAIPTLSAATDDPRPEVAARARRALRRVRLFALRNATNLDEPLRLADRYLATDSTSSRTAMVQQLAEMKPPPVDVLVRLFTLEPDEAMRARILGTLGGAYRAAIPRLVAEGDVDALPPLLEQAAAQVPYLGAPDYAIDQQLTGHWADAVARWRAELANGDGAHQALSAGMLCHLYRVAGQPDAAAEMARRTQDWKLILTTALDRGDWHAAAAAAATGWPAAQGAAMRAALNTLDGGSPGSVALTLSSDADAYNADPGSVGIGRVRLLLGDVNGGMAKLSADPAEGGDPVAAFALRQARGEYDDAFALANRFAHDPVVGPKITGPRDDLKRLLGDLPEATAERRATADDPRWTRSVADLAAHRYAAAAAELAPGEADPDHLDWWYVRGYALDAAGDSARGQTLMRSAALAPLADGEMRTKLAAGLAAAGLDAAAAEQRALGVRIAAPFADASELLDLHLATESAATAARDFATAAASAERVWLLCFWPGMAWHGPLPYLTVPADVHLARARLARSRDDWSTVRRELDAYHVLLPTSLDMPIEWVPLLDARGDHAAADGLFAAAYDALDGQSARHPNSRYLHNQAAWLAACCCRRLPEGLAHAEAASRLAPDDWQSADTLAEVHFRLGDRPAAAAIEKRAMANPDADVDYLARQLARFQKSPVPSTTRPPDAPS